VASSVERRRGWGGERAGGEWNEWKEWKGMRGEEGRKRAEGRRWSGRCQASFSLGQVCGIRRTAGNLSKHAMLSAQCIKLLCTHAPSPKIIPYVYIYNVYLHLKRIPFGVEQE
jgi:hypothetical protein